MVVFYTPTTSALYPPNPKNAVIPIMNEPPGRPYTEIGRFSFQADLGYSFMMRAIEYNARRVGADGALIKKIPEPDDSVRLFGAAHGELVPCWGLLWRSLWWVGWRLLRRRGHCADRLSRLLGVNYDTFTGIDARMIIFKP